jgi:hypothetical protein
MNLLLRLRRLIKGFVDSGIVNILVAIALVFIEAPFSHAQTITPATGYWLNPTASGSGFVIEVQGSKMFMAGFLYSENGEATWVGSVGPMTSPTVYSQPLITFSGGQTLTGAYVPPVQSANSLGNITITFTDDSHASLTWPGGTIPIQRFDFGPGGSETPQPVDTPQTGWWWNENESGRGFAIEVQGGAMFFAAYMYDASGNPTWYLSNGNMTSPTLYQGVWQQYAGGQTLTGTYVMPTVTNADVGSVTLQFTSPGAATLTLPNARQIPLTRFTFGLSGPTLTAFMPSAAAPATPIVISAIGIDTTQTLTLTLFDATGYSASIPLAAASATSIQAAVPPYVNVATSAFGSGVVNVKLTQTSTTTSVDSNVLTGFTIDPLPTVPGTAGQTTLALIMANLEEAQRLQTALQNSAISSPAVLTAIGQQVTDLQALVSNIQSVVQEGAAFSLGVVGGVDITVTPINITDVDNLILATLNALSNPVVGPALKGAEAAPVYCLSAEAAAFYNAVKSGTESTVQITQLAQNLMEASGSSPACNSTDAFASAYQIFGGAGNLGLGLSDSAGGSTNSARLPGATLFAAATQNANTALGLNALISPSLSGQLATVQQAIGNVAALATPTSIELLAKATGPVAANLNDAQNVISLVANPFQGTFSGAWNGSCSGFGAVGGSFTIAISANGSISGSFNGDASGSITGTITANGSFAAAGGSAGIASWSGEVSGFGNLAGSGSWSGDGCAGTWSS